MKYMVDASGDPSLMKSSDGETWAREFVSMTKKNPSMATDLDIISTWFIAAIKAGYEQKHEMHDKLRDVLFAVEAQMQRRLKDGTMVLIQ